MKIAYLGPQGTFSEEAAKLCASDGDELIPFTSFAALISAVETTVADMAVLPIEVSEEWVGRPVFELEAAVGARVAFLMRFGTGVLPDAKTIVQADDTIYVAALSGTITDVAAAALQAPEEN